MNAKQGIIWAVLFLTFLIYSPSLQHQFVNLDDNAHISDNPQVYSFNVKRIFSSTVQRTYIPLSVFSFALEYQIAGKNPFLYHLDNILLHLLVIFLIFRLGIDLGLQRTAATVAAFLFALHPMHVESVAWATERKDVLYSVFYLGAVLTYWRFLKLKKWSDYAFSLGLGLLSILAKPMALSLPLILFVCDWFYKRSFTKDDFWNKIPYTLFIFPIAYVTYAINTGIVGQNPGPGALLRFWAAAFYLKKFFWPILFVPHYIPTLPVEILRFEYASSVVIVALTIFSFFKFRNSWWRLALLWYFLSIFFILNFDYGRVVQMVADRYMYLPSVGFCFFAGFVVENLRQKKFFLTAVGKIVLWACLLSVAVFLSIKTFCQVRIWKDSFTLWNYTIKHAPTSYLAFNNRGRIYEKQQQFDLALADYKQTIQLNPQYEKGYKNLGMVYEGLGNIPAAIEAYSKAIEVKANYSAAYNNRGLLFEKKGDNSSALADFTQAIKGDPNYVLGYVNRGALLMKIGKIEQGWRDINTAIVLYQRMGAYDQALRQAQAARQGGCPVNQEYLNQLTQQCLAKHQCLVKPAF